MTLNQILLIGNAGGDAELRYTPNGDSVADFNLAVSRSRLVDGEWQTVSTEWFRISSWGRSAERVANTIKRGNRVFIEGRLSSNPYRTEGGEIRAGLQVSASRVINLTRSTEDSGYGSYGGGGGGGGFSAVPNEPAQATDAAPGPSSQDLEEGEDLPW